MILEAGALIYQGLAVDLEQDLHQFFKFHAGEVDGIAVEKPQANEIVRQQNLTVTDTISDLSRVTGDLSLYGINILA